MSNKLPPAAPLLYKQDGVCKKSSHVSTPCRLLQALSGLAVTFMSRVFACRPSIKHCCVWCVAHVACQVRFVYTCCAVPHMVPDMCSPCTSQALCSLVLSMQSHPQVITTLLSGRMFGEGDLLRHLSQLTYKLMYHQDPLAEFDFSLASMSVDLKDGLRLCKLAEALTGKMTSMVLCICALTDVQCDNRVNRSVPLWGLHVGATVVHGKDACLDHHCYSTETWSAWKAHTCRAVSVFPD